MSPSRYASPGCPDPDQRDDHTCFDPKDLDKDDCVTREEFNNLAKRVAALECKTRGSWRKTDTDT